MGQIRHKTNVLVIGGILFVCFFKIWFSQAASESTYSDVIYSQKKRSF